MLKNYLKIAFRNLVKYKNYSLINVTGLAIGTVTCILIVLYVQHELSYDRFFTDAEKIYRITMSLTVDGNMEKSATIEYPVGTLLRQYPEVKEVARLVNLSQNMIGQIASINYGEKVFYEERFYFADSTLFNVINLPLEEGDPNTALKFPNSVVITKKIAQKYFGNEPPLNKVLLFNNRIPMRVTGVLGDFPGPSHMDLDFLVSMSTLTQTNLPRPNIDFPHNWVLNWFYTYVKLETPGSAASLKGKLESFVQSNYPDIQRQNRVQLYIQPIRDIHLYSDNPVDITPPSDIRYVIVFGVIGLLVFMIACINFINLTVAQFNQRVKELGIRKVLGAFRRQLILQILMEAVLLATLACISSWLFTELSLPIFKNLTGISASAMQIWPYALIFIPFISIATGIYPAIIFSSPNPTASLKDLKQSLLKGTGLRKVLVVFQFVVSVVLIIATLTIHQQLQYMQNKDLGFHNHRVLMVPLRDSRVEGQLETFKNRLMQNPDVESVSGISAVIGKEVNYTTFQIEGIIKPQILYVCRVDQDFINTFGLKLLAGRNFSKEFPSDAKGGFIINEAAMRQFGWKDAVGKQIKFATMPGAVQGTIIGVVKDFHFMSLHESIKPLVLAEGFSSFSAIRVSDKNLPATLSYIGAAWKELEPDKGFTYSFLDKMLMRSYDTEDQIGRLTSYFSGLAVFIACLGLLGLVSFTAVRKNKEIGVRKVLGASVASVVGLLSQEFFKLVLLANLIAWPIAYYFMEKWLHNFAYRINIEVWTFLAAALLALLIAMLTISFHAIKAATANPVESLRYE